MHIVPTKISSWFIAFHLHLHPVRAGAELRCVEALDQGVAVVQTALLGDMQAVFQLVRPLRQMLDEELHVAVGVGLVVAHAVVVFVAGNLLDRFKAGGTQVLHKDVAHVLQIGEGEPHGDFVAHFEGGGALYRNQHLPFLRHPFHKELALDGQVLQVDTIWN